MFERIFDKRRIKNATLDLIEKIDSKSIEVDLESLIKDQNFVKNLSKNIKKILKEKIQEVL